MSSNSKYTFTSDWVSSKEKVWEQLISKTGKVNSILELGSYEGRSAVWFLENYLKESGSITCVDNWKYNTKELFKSNLDLATSSLGKSYRLVEGTSTKALAELIVDNKVFDVVYIDAEHRTTDVVTDACMAWNLIKAGGVIIFDDYLFRFNEQDINQSVKFAVDSFCNLFNGYFIYLYVGNQVIIQKK